RPERAGHARARPRRVQRPDLEAHVPQPGGDELRAPAVRLARRVLAGNPDQLGGELHKVRAVPPELTADRGRELPRVRRLQGWHVVYDSRACRSLMIVQAGRNARSKGGGKVRPARGPGKSASSRTSR